MSDFRLERLRRAGPPPPPDGGRTPPGTPAFLGVVTTATAPAGKFLLVHPVTVSGAETEGSAGVLAADGGTSVPVYLVGPRDAAVGDYLLCRFVNWRWVAEKMAPAAAPPPPADPCDGQIKVTVTGCGASLTAATVTATLGGVTMPAAAQAGNVWTFNNLCSGNYTVTTSAANFTTDVRTVTVGTQTISGVKHNTKPAVSVSLAPAAGWSCSAPSCCPAPAMAGPPYPASLTFPGTLYLNDGRGSVTLSPTGGVYEGNTTRLAANAYPFVSNDFPEPIPNQTVPVYFKFSCDPSQNYWALTVHVILAHHADGTGVADGGTHCPAVGGTNEANWLSTTIILGATGNPTACPSPFAWSTSVTVPAIDFFGGGYSANVYGNTSSPTTVTFTVQS